MGGERMTPEQRTLAIERIERWRKEGMDDAELREEFVYGLIYSLGEAGESVPVTPEDVEELVAATRHFFIPTKAAPARSPKALSVKVKPLGDERWYVIPSHPDYCISDRLRVCRLTASKRSPAGQLLAPRVRFFRGQVHCTYRLSRDGKNADLTVGRLLLAATRNGKKWAGNQ